MAKKDTPAALLDSGAAERPAPTHEVLVPMKHDKNYEPGDRITLTEADVAALPEGTVKPLDA